MRCPSLTMFALCLLLSVAACGDDPARPPSFRDEFRIEGFYTPMHDHDDHHANTLDRPFVAEGGDFRVTVVRADTAGSATFRISLIGGTATAGHDFAARTDTIVMEPGVLTRDYIIFYTRQDTTPEPTESMRLLLTSLSDDYGVATPELAIQIVDNDGPQEGGPIYFPLEVGRWWEYHGHTTSHGNGGFDYYYTETMRMEIVDEVEVGGVTYAVVSFGGSLAMTSDLAGGQYWRQSGQKLLRMLAYCPDVISRGGVPELCEPFFESQPWTLCDFSPEAGAWTAFSADTTLANEKSTYRYVARMESRGRGTVVTPAGVFHDVHSTNSQINLDTAYIYEDWRHSKGHETMTVADSVGIVQWIKRHWLQSSAPGLSGSSETLYLLTAYGASDTTLHSERDAEP